MTKQTRDPLLEAAMDRLTDIGPTWHEDDLQRWTELFASMVAAVYPPKPRRKSRAKAAA